MRWILAKLWPAMAGNPINSDGGSRAGEEGQKKGGGGGGRERGGWLLR